MPLFPDIEIYGHGYKNGLDPNSAALQQLLQRHQFQEDQRGDAFRTTLAGILARVRTPIKMPKLHYADDSQYYPLSVVVKDRDLQFLVEKPVAHVPRDINLERDEVYQQIEDRDDAFPMRKVFGDVPEDFLEIVAEEMAVLNKLRGQAAAAKGQEGTGMTPSRSFAMGSPSKKASWPSASPLQTSA